MLLRKMGPDEIADDEKEMNGYKDISPGVRDLVRELRQVHGMNTVDSGDGTNFANGMGCSYNVRHVFMSSFLDSLIKDTQYVADNYPDAKVECSWSPGEDAIIMMWPDGEQPMEIREMDGSLNV